MLPIGSTAQVLHRYLNEFCDRTDITNPDCRAEILGLCESLHERLEKLRDLERDVADIREQLTGDAP